MSKKVLIVKNITHEDAGLFEDILREKNIEYEVVDLSIGEKFPDPKNYSAVMVFGGPDSANDDTQKMKEELQKIKEIIDTEIPYLGICLGLQTLVKAVGGNVKDNEIKEVGCRDSNNNYFEINLTEDGKNDPDAGLISRRDLSDNQKMVVSNVQNGFSLRMLKKLAEFDSDVVPMVRAFENLENEQEIFYAPITGLLPHLIREHYLFEGRSTIYRADPAFLIRALNLEGVTN